MLIILTVILCKLLVDLRGSCIVKAPAKKAKQAPAAEAPTAEPVPTIWLPAGLLFAVGNVCVYSPDACAICACMSYMLDQWAHQQCWQAQRCMYFADPELYKTTKRDFMAAAKRKLQDHIASGDFVASNRQVHDMASHKWATSQTRARAARHGLIAHVLSDRP